MNTFQFRFPKYNQTKTHFTIKQIESEPRQMGCEYTKMQKKACSEIIELPSRVSSNSNTNTNTNMNSEKNIKSNSTRNKARACRRNILSKNDLTEQNIIPVINYTFMKTDYEFLKKILSSHFIFSELDHTQIMRLIQNMEVYKIEKDAIVFNEGDYGHRLFVIKSGCIQIQTKSKKNQKLGTGQCFGQLALIYRAPRSATARALQPSQFYCISYRVFHKTMEQVIIRNYGFIKSHVVQASIFKFLTMKQKIMITHKAQILNYNEGECIYKQGDQASALYIIAKGIVSIAKLQRNKVSLSSQQFFGQACLETGNPVRQESAMAVTDITIISIPLKDIQKCAKIKIFRLSYYSIIRRAFTQNDYLSKLPSKIVQKVITLAQIKWYSNKSYIQTIGVPHRQFYICLQGMINNKSVGSVHNIEQLIQTDDNKDKCMEIVKNGDGYVAVFSIEAIQKQVGWRAMTNLKEYGNSKKNICINNNIHNDNGNINVNVNGHGNDNGNDNGNQTEHTFEDKINKISISNLNVTSELKNKNIEQSNFKRVLIVEDPENNNQYTLVCLNNNYNHKDKQIFKAIKNHKLVLSTLSSSSSTSLPPFMPVLYKYQCEKQSSMFLISYIGSCSFRQILTQVQKQSQIQIPAPGQNQRAGFNFEQIRFVMACLVCLLEQAHNKNIALRNLSPDSLTINQKKGPSYGYLSFNDFSQSKLLEQANGYRTFTVVGSPHYMAPEMIAGRGYSFAVDLWALGIILYEIVSGMMPFGDDSDDPYHIFQDIYLSTGFPVPSKYVQPSCLTLISLLINKDESERNVENYKQLKSMQYFEGFNWSKLQNQQIKSPIVCSRPIYSTQKCIMNQSVKTYLAQFINQFNKQCDESSNTNQSKNM